MVIVQVSVQGAQQLRELEQRFKKAGRLDLRTKMRRQIRAAAQPVVVDLRAAVLRVRVTSTQGGHARPDRSTGLRRRTARALGVSTTRQGVRIRVSERRFGPYGVTLPRYLDSELRKFTQWRHPVFWKGPISTAPAARVVQQKGDPWFFTTINRHLASFRRAVFRAMDDVAEELTR